MADKLSAPVYSSDGASKGEVTLDAALFGIEPNMAVLHQVVTAQLAAARAGTHSTKTRAEVRGGGRKPWRQKGLGRARHGSIRSPSWTGGGVAHGPKPRDYNQRTPKKMKRLALRSALSARAGQGQVRVVDRFDWQEPKTKRAADLLQAIEAGTKVLMVLDRADTVASLSLRNLQNVVVNGQLNPYDVLWADTVVFTTSTLNAATGASDYSVGDEDFVKEGDSSEPAAANDELPAVGQTEESKGEAQATEDADTDSDPEADSGELVGTDEPAPGEASDEKDTE